MSVLRVWDRRLSWVSLAFGLCVVGCESADGDAPGSGGGSSVSGWDAMQDALVACGVWEKGDLSPNLDSPDGRCIAACIGTHEDCETATAYACQGLSAVNMLDTELARCISSCRDFTCKNGVVTRTFNLCDGQDDCGDGSDELGCPERETFTCNDGAELPIADRCNREIDCGMLEDEMDCPEEAFFRCDEYEYYPAIWECDLRKDCSNGSDEGPRCAHALCPTP